MNVFRGLGGAAFFFVASFALHIVGGATDQGWLFALAVALIYLAATGFPAVALILGGITERGRAAKVVVAAGSVAGVVLTMAALWAANGRETAPWHFAAAIAMVLANSAVLLALRRLLRQTRRTPPEGAATSARASRTQH